MNQPHKILSEYWGYQNFRPGQLEIIEAVIQNKNVLAILPTGGGKSICFQVPALIKEGLCLVVSPLIALMKDQVQNLVNKGIKAACLHSGMNFYEANNLMKDVVDEDYRFLYVSPERLSTKNFKQWLSLLNVSLLVIDEAHCISQWGYDFRPSYLSIAEVKKEINSCPVIALTASATKQVANDIIEKLQIKNAALFRQSFSRPNLSFSVFKVESKVNKLVEILKKVAGSSLVFCSSRIATKELSRLLCNQGIHADFYHAGLDFNERIQKQNAWMENKTRVMVCTNAFGMGIDKADVRTVVHYHIPDCLENYYQEAGRAGRDGKPAYAVMLYEQNDLTAMDTLVDLRFPSIEIIKTIYRHVCDYLNVPEGIGEYLSFDFDLSAFCKSFNQNPIIVANALKIFEQQGLFTLTDGFLIPPRLGFTTSRSILNDIEKNHPQTDEIIKFLLRTYHGIFDYEVSINEKALSSYVKLPVEKVQQCLMQLHTSGVVCYTPQKTSPQIIFQHNRVRAENLYLDAETFFKRKKLFEKRIEHFKKYLNHPYCRSRVIGNYFGDEGMAECGICDNCLSKKHKKFSREEFSGIQKKIIDTLHHQPVLLNTFLFPLKNSEKKKTLEVLNYMQEEQKIEIDKNGLIRKKESG